MRKPCLPKDMAFLLSAVEERRVKKVFKDLIERICMVLVVALAVIVFLQVFNRFVLKTPLAWSEDLAMLLFQWVAFLGAAVGVKRMRHFGIELVVKKMSAKARHGIERLTPILIGFVALTMITEGMKLIQFNRNRIYSSMDLSYIWAYLAIPVSGLLIIIFLIQHEVRLLRERKEARRE
jgi:TRAP-type C4-dicarboxylate transport system permease small subunit